MNTTTREVDSYVGGRKMNTPWNLPVRIGIGITPLASLGLGDSRQPNYLVKNGGFRLELGRPEPWKTES